MANASSEPCETSVANFVRDTRQICGNLAPLTLQENSVDADSGVDHGQLLVERFTEKELPPHMPEDSFFQFSQTTIFVRSTTPGEIANIIIDWLLSEPTMSIINVNRKKFSIKARVFSHHFMMCMIGIRLYWQGDDKYAIEFIRRSGDCLTFSGFFHRIATFLKHQVPKMDNPPETVEQFSPRCPDHDKRIDGGDFEPILDMAACHDLPALQVESAVALAHIAQDYQAAPALCNDPTIKALKGLLCTGRKDIEHPAAHALSSMARHPECKPCLIDQELTSIVQNVIHSSATTLHVRNQLAQALDTVAINTISKVEASLGL